MFAVSLHRRVRSLSHLSKQTKNNENDPKAFWKTCDNLNKKDTQPSIPILMASWFANLSNLYSENNDDLDLINLESVTAGPLDFPFTCKEVRKGISKLKNNEQPGLDLIHNKFIKLGRKYFFYHL